MTRPTPTKETFVGNPTVDLLDIVIVRSSTRHLKQEPCVLLRVGVETTSVLYPNDGHRRWSRGHRLILCQITPIVRVLPWYDVEES